MEVFIITAAFLFQLESKWQAYDDHVQKALEEEENKKAHAKKEKQRKRLQREKLVQLIRAKKEGESLMTVFVQRLQTVEPPNKGHYVGKNFVPCREVVPILEVILAWV